jgi:hypothetical protein
MIRAIAITLLFAASLALMIAAHADTELGRAAAKDVIESMGSNTSRGTVRIARVRSLPPGRFSMLGYRMIAPNGETVIQAEEIAGTFDWTGLFEGQIRFRPSTFVRARIRLTPGPRGQINLVHASEVPDDVSAMPLVFQDIQLVDNTILVALPGKPPITMTHVGGRADLHIGHFWHWSLTANRGHIDLPIVDAGFRNMNGRLRSDHAHPLFVNVVVDTAIIEPAITLDYYVPALAGREGEPHLDLDLGTDGIDETEEQEEARDRLSEAREELGERREEARGADRGEAPERREALRSARREEAEAEREAERAGVDRPRQRRERDTPSAREERHVAELARRRG